jgi:hypothetical protein
MSQRKGQVWLILAGLPRPENDLDDFESKISQAQYFIPRIAILKFLINAGLGQIKKFDLSYINTISYRQLWSNLYKPLPSLEVALVV